MDKIAVGKKIRSIRKELGQSMAKFGETIDKQRPVKSGVVSNWENGKQLPNNERSKKIAELGNMTINELFYDSPEEYLIDELGGSFFNKLDNNVDIDGIYFILSVLVEKYAKSLNKEYYQNYNLINELDLEDLLKFVKLNINNYIPFTLEVLNNIVNYIKMQNSEIIKKRLPSELAEIIIESKENNLNINASTLLNYGFILSSIDPYDYHEHSDSSNLIENLKEFNYRYLTLLEHINNNDYDPNILLADSFVIERIINEILSLSEDVKTKDKINLFIPYNDFLRTVNDEQLPALRLNMNKELFKKSKE